MLSLDMMGDKNQFGYINKQTGEDDIKMNTSVEA